jgi:hypothetical protein
MPCQLPIRSLGHPPSEKFSLATGKLTWLLRPVPTE